VDFPPRSKPKLTSTESLLAATILPSAFIVAAKRVVSTLLEPGLSSVASAGVCAVEMPSFKVSFFVAFELLALEIALSIALQIQQ